MNEPPDETIDRAGAIPSTGGDGCGDPPPEAFAPRISCIEEFLDPRWIRRVARTADIDLRSYRIALTYWKLATHLDDLVYGEQSVRNRLERQQSAGTCNANWFHFAAWSTTTITQNIANQRPPQRVGMLPSEALRRRLTPAVIQARASSGQRVARALSWGQRLIFVSSCLTLERLHRWLEQPDKTRPPSSFELDSASRDPILELGKWDDCPWIDRKRHLDAIVRAFRLYIHARAAFHPPERLDNVSTAETFDPEEEVRPNEKASAQYVLGGNLRLAAVDQDLIDPAIETVVNHLPQAVTARVDATIARWVERSRGIPSQLTSLNLPFRYLRPREAFETAWSRLMTDQVFVMALPTETLRLGRDIPPRYPGQPYFPSALVHLTASKGPELRKVVDLVNALDRTTGNGHGSAARDWRRWDERMNWAVTLMRSRQQDETLFWAPFSEADQQRIVDGRLPTRSGDPSALDVQPPGDAAAFRALAMMRGVR